MKDIFIFTRCQIIEGKEEGERGGGREGWGGGWGEKSFIELGGCYTPQSVIFNTKPLNKPGS